MDIIDVQHNSNNECTICFEEIENEYAIISDNVGEQGKYHTKCIEEWLTFSKSGILTQFEIKTVDILTIDGEYVRSINANEYQSVSKSFFNSLFIEDELSIDDDDSLAMEETFLSKFLCRLCCSVFG